MSIKTTRSDVVANFVRYHGRQPKASDEATIQYLTTKAPIEVEKLLAKNSPITKGLVWSEYNKQKSSNKQNNKPKPTSENKPMLTMKEANDPKYWKNGIYVGHNNQENKTEEATLYKEGNETEIVEVGSEKASELQKDGYTLNNKVEEKVEEKRIEDETDDGGTVDLSMYQNMIDNSIVLTELFNNPAYKEQFGKLSMEGQLAQIQLQLAHEKVLEAGKVVNPNIEISMEQVKKFTDDALTELDPYYQEQIGNYKDDLDTSISRLTEDFNTGVRNSEDPYKRNLAVVAENEAQAGTVYGSERKVRENINVENQQRAIDETSRDLGREIEDQYTKAERALGSDVISGIDTPKINEYKVSNQGIQQSGSRDLFNPKGGLVGSLQKEKEVNVRGRVSELKEDYRKKRILNTSQL